MPFVQVASTRIRLYNHIWESLWKAAGCGDLRSCSLSLSCTADSSHLEGWDTLALVGMSYIVVMVGMPWLRCG